MARQQQWHELRESGSQNDDNMQRRLAKARARGVYRARRPKQNFRVGAVECVKRFRAQQSPTDRRVVSAIGVAKRRAAKYDNRARQARGTARARRARAPPRDYLPPRCPCWFLTPANVWERGVVVQTRPCNEPTTWGLAWVVVRPYSALDTLVAVPHHDTYK